MANNVTVNFQSIIIQLHKIALEKAKAVNPNIILDNLMINDDANALIYTKNNEYQILMKAKEEDKVPQKTDFHKTVQEYINWFVGKDEAGYVKEQHLTPIWNMLSSDSMENKEQYQERSENTEEKKQKEEDKLSESFKFYDNKEFIDLLFEAEESEDQNNNKENDTSVEQSNTEEDKDRKVVGYGLKYKMDIVDGKKQNTSKDSFSGRKRGWFGATWADLKNIKIEINGKPVHIGKIFDPSKWKEMVGIIDINVDTVSSNIRNIFDKRYPNSDVKVKYWEGKHQGNSDSEIDTFLNRRGKNTPEIHSKVTSTDYVVSIMVDNRDPNYPKYNKKLMADVCTDAFGTSENKFSNSNKVNEKDVIKISNCDDNDKYTSTYDQKIKGKVDVTGQQLKKQSSKNQVKEAEEQNAENKHDNEQKKEVISSVLENIKTQIEKVIPEYEVIGPSISLTKDFVQSDDFKKLNDSKLAYDLERESQSVYHFLIKQAIKNGKLDESRFYAEIKDAIGLLLEELNLTEGDDVPTFGTPNDNNGENQNTPDFGGKEAIKASQQKDDAPEGTERQKEMGEANLTGNKKDDEKIKELIVVQKENTKQIDKLHKEIKEKVLKIFQNAIYDTIKEKNIDLSEVKLNMRLGSYTETVGKVNEENNIQNVVDTLFEAQGKNIGDIPLMAELYHFRLLGQFSDMITSETGNHGWQADPFSAVTTSKRIVEYLKAHKIGGKDEYDKILEHEYSAIFIAKRDLEGTEYRGSDGNKCFTTDTVSKIWKDVFGDTSNMVSILQCNPENRRGVAGELFERSLGYNKDRSKNKQVPCLIDVWINPFELKQIDQQQSDTTEKSIGSTNPELIPSEKDFTITFISILPDPIYTESDEGKDPGIENDNLNTQEKSEVNKDLYIIPHPRLKKMSERPNREIRRDDGTVVVKTSDDEYKP